MNATLEAQPQIPDLADGVIDIDGNAIEASRERAASRYVIDDDAKLFRYHRKCDDYDAQVATIKAQALVLIAEVEANKRKYSEWFGPQAASYVKERLEATGSKIATYKTLLGNAQLTKVPAKIEVVDTLAARAYSREHQIALRPKTGTEWNETDYKDFANDAMAAGSPLPPGTKLIVAHESVNFKVADKSKPGDPS